MTDSSRMDIISLGLGVISLLLTVYFSWKTQKAVDLIWSHVDQKIMGHIMRRLDAGEKLTTSQIVGIALNVATEYHVKIPNSKHLVRLLRRIALRYEENYSARNRKKVEVLEPIRVELEPNGPPLMSIADTSRLLALFLMLFTIVILLFVAHIIRILLPERNLPLAILLVIGEFLTVAFSIHLFWQCHKKYEQIQNL